MRWLALLCLSLSLGWLWQSYRTRPVSHVGGISLQVQELLGGSDPGGFAPVVQPRKFSFPADHGPHFEQRTEWWYVTGNLVTPEGRPYGFQLTFFRQASASASPTPPTDPSKASQWRSRQLFMGHFTLSDIQAAKFHSGERFARQALGLAGAEGGRVWLEDWSLQFEGDDIQLSARDGDRSLKLQLHSQKPAVLQGDNGLSRKGPKPGEASYYYSLPRLEASGELRIGAQSTPVRGSAWLDREWSSRSLPPDLQGWDWFCLQMDDNSELMFYRLRRPDGSATQLSAGSWVDPQGKVRHLKSDEVELAPQEWWTSPRDGTRYPLAWSIQIKDGPRYIVKPRIQDQELNLAVRYWEGAIQAQTDSGVKGVGFLELVGYPTPKK